MNPLRSGWFWAVVFGAVFVLSIDIWSWEQTEPALFGLPYIILQTILLEALLFLLFLLFTRTYWKDLKGDEGR